MPIENAVVEALNAQMGRELEAHLQYLSVSSWFDSEGLPELHRFFAAQAAEEHAHAMKFLTYIQDVGRPASRSRRLAAPKADFESAEEAVRRASTGRTRSPGTSTTSWTWRSATRITPRRRSSSGS